MKDNIKKKVVQKLENDSQREVVVCLAIQKLGLASMEDIQKKVEDWQGKMTQIQVATACKKLQNKGLVSVDLGGKNEDDQTITRYLMKRLTVSIPEVAQIKDIVDNPEMKPLIELLESKARTAKKSRAMNYYKVKARFKAQGQIQGFIPDKSRESTDNISTIMHYRDPKGNIIFLPYHFRKWIQQNIALINRFDTVAERIKYKHGTVQLNGSSPVFIEKFITNVGNNPRSGGGRGKKRVECLPEGCLVETEFIVPEDEFQPEEFKKALSIICEHGSAFGGEARLSNGRFELENVEIGDFIWS